MIRSALPIAAAMILLSPAAAWPARPAASSPHCTAQGLSPITQRFRARVRQKDLRVLDLFTPDAVVTGPDQSESSGRSQLRKLFAHAFRTFDSDYRFRSVRVFPSAQGGCVQEGLFQERLRTRGRRGVSRVTGEYGFSYVKVGTSWRFSSMKWIRYTPEE